MTHVDFARPVTVLVGLGMPRSIGSASEALVFLRERPATHHDEAWQATLDVCREAVVGRAGPQEAHDVFSAFARRHRLLLLDVLPQREATKRRMAA